MLTGGIHKDNIERTDHLFVLHHHFCSQEGFVKTTLREYGIEENVTELLKSAWKRAVKQRIEEYTEEEIKRTCRTLSKARTTLQDDRHETRNYLKESTIKEAKKILIARLHMTKIPCNYRTSEIKGCWLCGQQNEIRTEHYYECSGTRILRRNWSAKKEHLNSPDTNELTRTSMFLEKVVEMFKPKWEIGGP